MTSWRRRNWPWLLALVPVLALTALAASQPLLTLYLPWIPSRAHVAVNNSIEFHHSFHEGDLSLERQVHIELLQIAPVEELDGMQAVPGAQLWQVDLSFEASPDQLLQGCKITLHADQVSYSYTSAQVSVGGSFSYRSLDRCVPADTPGPVIDDLAGGIVEDTPPRPSTWQTSTAFALPEGVTPDELHLGWNPPDYVVFKVS